MGANPLPGCRRGCFHVSPGKLAFHPLSPKCSLCSLCCPSLAVFLFILILGLLPVDRLVGWAHFSVVHFLVLGPQWLWGKGVLMSPACVLVRGGGNLSKGTPGLESPALTPGEGKTGSWKSLCRALPHLCYPRSWHWRAGPLPWLMSTCPREQHGVGKGLWFCPTGPSKPWHPYPPWKMGYTWRRNVEVD